MIGLYDIWVWGKVIRKFVFVKYWLFCWTNIHQKFGRNYFPPPIFLKIVWNVVLLNVIPSNQVELDRIKIEIIMLILLPGLTTTFPPRKPPKQNIEYIISQKRNPSWSNVKTWINSFLQSLFFFFFSLFLCPGPLYPNRHISFLLSIKF